MSMHILLVDDHTLVRAGIRALIDGIPGFEVIAEADDGDQAIEIVREQAIDIVVTDITMKRMSGLDIIPVVKASSPATRIIMLSMHLTDDFVLQAMKAGASAYLLKDAATTELELALRAVARGESYLSPLASKHVLEHMISGGRPPERRPPERRPPERQPGPVEDDPLTPRQREILRLIAQGRATKEIAYDLGLSPKTVEAHRAQIMERLNIHEVAGLARYAIRVGLIPLGE